MPTKVVDLEVSSGFKSISGLENYEGLTTLVRYRGQPIGWVYIPVRAPEISAKQLKTAVIDELGWQLMEVVLGQQFGENESNITLPPISIVVCTHNRTDLLEPCLRSLRSLDYPKYEIIVVDHTPSRDDTARMVSDLPVRYVCEDRPGLSWARNRGIEEARYDIIAFIDDDAQPDRKWLKAIARAFANSDVMAVTGLVAPVELETSAQIFFEYGYGLGRGLQKRVVRTESVTDRELLWANNFGVGTNMAFRRSIFAQIGSFDVALGLGTPSRGGGDLEMLHRLVAGGFTLVYEPTILVWHLHRRDNASLRKFAYRNGLSFGTYLLTCGCKRTVGWNTIISFAVRDWLGWWILRRQRQPHNFPKYLVGLELIGALISPLAYKRTQSGGQKWSKKSLTTQKS